MDISCFVQEYRAGDINRFLRTHQYWQHFIDIFSITMADQARGAPLSSPSSEWRE